LFWLAAGFLLWPEYWCDGVGAVLFVAVIGLQKMKTGVPQVAT
jgi:hypothetical protein